MNLTFRALAVAAALSVSHTPAIAQQVDRATIIILDASGSMWGQLEDGRTKIEVAREVMGGFLGPRDVSVPLGVIAYGHNRRGDCSDIEVIAPLGGQSAAELSALLEQLNPKGKTPLGQSLRVAASEIPATAEEADIVLVTDGLETCGVDPCAVAAELSAERVDIRAHIVGFGLTEAEASVLTCVPAATGGLLMRPQSGSELAEALSRVTAEPPPAAMTGVRLIFSYPGAMPETYSWALRNDETGEETALGEVSGEARYRPYAVELPPGPYTAIVTERAGQGEARFAVTGEPQDVVVTMQGLLPVARLRDRGPYAARGQTVMVDLGVVQAGQEAGGAALALRLYRPDGGEAITYATVDGAAGVKNAGINLPETPGLYLLRLESWGGEVVEELIIASEIDPAVTLLAPPVVEPGAVIEVQSIGSQLSSDRIEIWQGENRIDWGLTLSDFGYGNVLSSPTAPGLYDLVYRGYDPAGNQVEKARIAIEVGAVTDDATGADMLNGQQGAVDDGHGPDYGADGRPWSSYPYRCLTDDKVNPICEYRDEATGLSFMLPEGWVADQPSDTPMSAGAQAAGEKAPPFAEFWEVGGNLNHIILNPRQWIDDNGPCVFTRAGQLCLWRNVGAPDDPAAAEALSHLQSKLTTGEVIRRCGDDDCSFSHPASTLTGMLPPRWSAEVPRKSSDEKFATWFFDRAPRAGFKLLGLNQEGGDNCLESRAGLLCEFTPYVSTQEFDLIRETLDFAGARPSSREVLDILSPSRQPAPPEEGEQP